MVDDNTVRVPGSLPEQLRKNLELEPTDPNHPLNMMKEFEAFRETAMARYAEDNGLEIPDANGNRMLLTGNIDPRNREKYPFRVSIIGKDGEPRGHEIYRDFDEALKSMPWRKPAQQAQQAASPATAAVTPTAPVEASAEPVSAAAEPAATDNAATAAALGIRYDGVQPESPEPLKFTDTDKTSPAYGATFYVPDGATAEQVAAKLSEKRAQFAEGARKLAEKKATAAAQAPAPESAAAVPERVEKPKRGRKAKPAVEDATPEERAIVAKLVEDGKLDSHIRNLEKLRDERDDPKRAAYYQAQIDLIRKITAASAAPERVQAQPAAAAETKPSLKVGDRIPWKNSPDPNETVKEIEIVKLGPTVATVRWVGGDQLQRLPRAAVEERLKEQSQAAQAEIGRASWSEIL